MTRTTKKIFLIIFLFLLLVIISNINVKAAEIELQKGHATAYCLHGITASGEEVRDGICASCSSRLGKTIILYQRLPNDGIGKLIGIYECKDTGGTKGIKSGNVIDIWRPDMDACQEFMDIVYLDGCQGKVWIQVVDSF